MTFDLSTCLAAGRLASRTATAFAPSAFVAVDVAGGDVADHLELRVAVDVRRARGPRPGRRTAARRARCRSASSASPGRTSLPLRSTRVDAAAAAEHVGEHVGEEVRRSRRAAPAPGVAGADGLSSNSCVGVTMSGLPSPVMSPTAARGDDLGARECRGRCELASGSRAAALPLPSQA